MEVRNNIHTLIYTCRYTHKEERQMNNMELTRNNHRFHAIQRTDGFTPDLFYRFIRYVDAKPKTVETYTRALKQLQNYFIDQNILEPKREDILQYRDQLSRTHKPTTVQNYITTVKIFFKWLEQENIYPNIADGIKGAKLNRDHKKDYLTSEQVKDILSNMDASTLKGKRDYAMFALAVTGGLRTIEISRANIEDMRTIGDNTVLYVQGKGRDEKTDYIKIELPIEKAIRSYLKARGDATGSEPLFTSTSNNNKGNRLTTRSISGVLKKCMVDAGYDSERWTAHSLRHTAVTLSLLAGKELSEVQQFARHTNISTTQIYNHAIEKSKNTCGEAIANAIF